MASGDLTISGNHDRWVSGPDPHAWAHPIDTPIRNSTRIIANGRVLCRPLRTQVITSSPATAHRPNDNRYLIEEVSERRLERAHPSAIQERLGDVHARVVLCGHSHQPHLIKLPGGPLFLNPGSVGCPTYDDPGDDPHVSESGSPHARYAVLSIGELASAEMLAVSYDWKAASARAETNGRTEWAYGLRTGWFVLRPG